MVIDNSDKMIRMYYDGKEFYSKKISLKKKKGKLLPFQVVAPQNYFTIGRRANKGGYFRGYIDEIEIFRRALKPNEIKNAYETGKPKR